jgi:hypothetical protein
MYGGGVGKSPLSKIIARDASHPALLIDKACITLTPVNWPRRAAPTRSDDASRCRLTAFVWTRCMSAISRFLPGMQTTHRVIEN